MPFFFLWCTPLDTSSSVTLSGTTKLTPSLLPFPRLFFLYLFLPSSPRVVPPLLFTPGLSPPPFPALVRVIVTVAHLHLLSLPPHGPSLLLLPSLVNGDIATGAAIAYSKLNLTGNITNADINAVAALAKSKLNLTVTITNNDINANAAIADTKLNTITTAGKVSGSAITSGTIGGSTAISTTGNISTTGTLSDGIGPVRSIPRNSQSAAYTLQASDSGKFIRVTNGVNITITQSIIPAFQIGDNVTIYNDSSTSTIQIIQGANATLVTGGQTTTGTRTLATNGVATLLCVDTNKFVITGTGLT